MARKPIRPSAELSPMWNFHDYRRKNQRRDKQLDEVQENVGEKLERFCESYSNCVLSGAKLVWTT
jgi:hypothetical protein